LQINNNLQRVIESCIGQRMHNAHAGWRCGKSLAAGAVDNITLALYWCQQKNN